ncbi:hypothetical protein KR222_004750 [Zaprionus bogoriensis]|nr:hypothetical protein KR222_004750 [Zaprionus bogoriensis]
MPTVQVCLQWTAVIFNTFTLLLGTLAALAGVYDLLYKLEEGSALHIDIERLAQFTIAGVLILTAIIGCSGAFLGSIKVLVVHIVLLVLLIAAHIWTLSQYHNKTKEANATEVFVMDSWMKELTLPGAMDMLQKRYKCCGQRGYMDYKDLHMKVPPSCYHSENGIQALYPYSESCTHAVMHYHMRLYQIELWAHIGLICYEIIGIILGITLCCQLTTKPRRYAY